MTANKLIVLAEKQKHENDETQKMLAIVVSMQKAHNRHMAAMREAKASLKEYNSLKSRLAFLKSPDPSDDEQKL